MFEFIECDAWCLASFRGVPVKDEPGGVNGSDYPAVSAKHVDQQHSARSTWRGKEREWDKVFEWKQKHSAVIL